MIEQKLLSLHHYRDGDGNWYVVAAIETEQGALKKVVFRARSHLRPVFYTQTGELVWEPKNK